MAASLRLLWPRQRYQAFKALKADSEMLNKVHGFSIYTTDFKTALYTICSCQ